MYVKYNTCKKQEKLRLLTLCTVTTFVRYRSQLCVMPSSVFCKTVYKRQIHLISLLLNYFQVIGRENE